MRDKLEATRYPGVYRRPNGTFVVRIKAVSDRTGQPVERMLSLPEDATLAEARLIADDLREQARNRVEKVLPPSLRAFGKEWVVRKLERGEWTAGGATKANVEHHLRAHINPVLGDYRLDKITPADLEAWVDGQVRTGNKMNSVRTRWVTLKNLIGAGCRMYRIVNPADGVKLPKGASMTRGGKDLVLMPEQLRTLIAIAREKSPDCWHPLLMLGFSTGARPSELVAIRVKDLDLTAEVGKWQIRQHWVAGKIVAGTKQHEEGRPSYIDPETTRVLRILQQQRRQLVGEEGWMFPAGGRSADSGRCVTTTGLWVWLQKVLPELNLPALSGKALRQTNVTLSAMAGISQAITMAQVGHSSQAVHAIYNRPPEQPRQDAARKLGEVIHLDERRVDADADVGAKVGTKVGTGTDGQN